MNKQQKADIIKDATERLSRANGLYLVNFSGMTVFQANNLRREFFKLEADYIVIKNTLLKRALQEIGGYDDVYPYLVQQTGLVVSYNDPVAPARILEKFNKDNAQKPAVKVCVIEKQVFDGSRLSEIAALPSRNDLIAGIMGALNAPAQGIVGAINAVMSDIVYAIDAIEKKKSQAA
ncbi:MAG: 50S ribosomal protein L10 [Ignavibacteriae bacterium]|nr:50S ribosomal protein L10 [Ignavibacteriota bacterium]